MSNYDDFDTITAEEFYESDYLDLIEEAPGDTTDEPPYVEADYDDLAMDEDTGSPIDTERMARESAWTKAMAEEIFIAAARVGGQYHGPSNEAGLTSREYWEMRYEEEDELERLRNDW